MKIGYLVFNLDGMGGTSRSAITQANALAGDHAVTLLSVTRSGERPHYWIDERQIPNGELGGKPDDDVETLRWWPTLMFSGDAKVTGAFGRMAEGVWFSRRIHLGYSRAPRDVEHSAEYIADTVPMTRTSPLGS